jgi:oligopeptide transport system permease protein
LLAGGLIWLFVLRLNWLPAATLQTPAHWVLPVLTLAAAPLTWTFLVTRTALKEARLRPFIRVKDSYGLPPVWLLWRHLMPSVWLPLLSLLGPLAAALLTGSFAVETLFAIPGLGKFFVSSVVNRDYPVVMALTCLYGGLLILFNTAAEVCQAWLDPRLRGV